MNWDLVLVVAGHGLSFISFGILFVLVAIGRRSSPHRGPVLVATAGTSLWALGTLAAAFIVEKPVIVPFLEWPRLAGWVWFMLAILAAAAPARAAAYRRLAYVGMGLPLLALCVLTLLDAMSVDTPGMRKITHLGQAVALIGMIVFALALLETMARWMSASGRKAATYFFLGVGTLLAIDLFLYAIILLLGRVDAPIYEARGLISSLAAPLIALALARQRDWLVDIHLSRQVIVNAATLMGVGIYLLAMALAGLAVRELDASWGPALHITFIAGALILLAAILSSDGFRPRLNAFVSRHFYSAKYDYRQEWLRFSNALSTDAAKSAIEERVLQAILESVACKAGCLWLRSIEGDGYVVAAAKPSSLLFREEPHIAVAALMDGHNDPISISSAAETSAAFNELEADEVLSRPWAGVPIRHRGQLVGFLVLAQPIVSRPLDAEDREFLQALSVQASAHLTEERAAIALDRARRFELSARRMTYVAHDLKNIVSQLSMALQNWSRLKTNVAFLAELPSVLENAVDRMKRLLEGLRSDAGAAATNDNSAIDVGQCLTGLVPLWRARYERLLVGLPAEQVFVHGPRDRLQSILDQLVSNAIEASDGSGEITLNTRFADHALVVEITDHGSGISEKKVVESRFAAGDTQKRGGYGVGLFQVRDYVRRFGGRLMFATEPGAGTTATLTLPATLHPAVGPETLLQQSPIRIGETALSRADLNVAVHS